MERKDGLSILASQGWLAGTPAKFRSLFLSAARWHRIERGATVTLGGEERDDVIGVASGTVAITSSLGQAGTPVTHLAHAVMWMGYGPILKGQPRVVTVEARTQLWIAQVPSAAILPLLNETTRWWRCFTQLLAEYGDTSAIIASDLLIRRSDQRLAATLLRFAGLRTPGTGAVTHRPLPTTQAELADASNLSRNAAGTILRKFAAAGLIRIRYGGLEVTDSKGLLRLVGQMS